MVDPLNLILGLVVAGLVPFLAVVATSFIKISIVLLLVRNALGVQQIPPNLVLNALAIILSGYIMAPVFVETFNILTTGQYGFGSVAEVTEAFNAAKDPLLGFMDRHADMREKTFFVEAARDIWPPELQASISEQNLAIMLPAFTVSQLREAFEIGFLLYLPFIAIDLIVSNILLAMGMMMVSPLTISLPFKLFLFVMVDGWSRLMLGLITTYT
ncbi:MAG: type III secretion system export apparatus subunit SctR [Paracoccaceae bacterium]